MKTKIIILSVLVMVGLFAIPSTVATAESPMPTSTVTTVSFLPSFDTRLCERFAPRLDYNFLEANTPQWDNLTDYTRTDTSTTFVVKFKLLKNLCAPFTARATVYNLPAGATPAWLPTAWPQTRYSSFAFEVQESGTYTVTFSKSCLAQQFDVHTGSAPQRLESLNDSNYHGPLLFGNPFMDAIGINTDASASIWYGSSCEVTTSSTSSTTTSTSTSTTSSTTTTTTTTTTSTPTTASTSSTTSTSTPVSVLGTVVTRPGDPGDPGNPGSTVVLVKGTSVSNNSNTLPVTGSSSYLMTSIALVFIASGAIFLVATRRRRTLIKS